jgi:hypothetical protein
MNNDSANREQIKVNSKNHFSLFIVPYNYNRWTYLF